MSGTQAKRQPVIRDISSRVMRRHTTAAVLFHHALAERLGLGPTDLKCLDVLCERGPMTGSELAALTGHTTGAITGVVTRLEESGYLSRKPDADDGRKQRLSAVESRMRGIHDTFRRMHEEHAAMLTNFDARALASIAEFLDRSAEAIYREIGLLRAERVNASRPSIQESRRSTAGMRR